MLPPNTVIQEMRVNVGISHTLPVVLLRVLVGGTVEAEAGAGQIPMFMTGARRMA